MGLRIDREEFDASDRARFAERLRESLDALRALLERPGFGEGPTTLGGEVEISIIDAGGRALPLNRTLLAGSPDPRLQLELDRFNLECNLSPVPIAGAPFSALAAETREALDALGSVAAEHGGRVVPIGILPTLRLEDLEAASMTDLPRYRALSAALRELRQRPFEVHIEGEESLRASCEDVTLEGGNTSFQVHLRVSPREFAATYNAVQLATPLAVALGANSPVFLEHKLWDETRVALFKQSVDSRGSQGGDWRLPARVAFGHGWVRRGAFELFAENVALYPPLLPITTEEDPLACVRGSGLPRLAELRLHQGTVWRWNRAIYDPDAGGHLRIEMRSLPAGPTALDMVSSAAWLLGLAVGLRGTVHRLLPGFPFEYAHRNFYHAARHGLDADLLWPADEPPSPEPVPVPVLARRLLPVAESGLEKLGVDADEARLVLDVIRARIESATTPARWQRRVLERLERTMPRSEALVGLLESYLREAKSGRPAAEWSEAP